MSSLNYFASHTNKMANTFHRKGNSFNVTNVIQPKLHNCVHHFYLSCLTTNNLN